MSSSSRQSSLFAGEVWTVLYRAFNSINFNASDPPSIAQALRTYIQTTFPEDFNDWTENSEFVAIIEMLSWLAGNLAFKTDLSVRENFLDTAELRESILRLARFLSYNPARNQPATGIVKLVEVSTDDDVYDSFGTNLNGQSVVWNNADDANWFERFTAVLNNAFVPTNPFGIPLKEGTLSSIPTQLYRINNRFDRQNVAFNASVSGQGMAFELCNGDFIPGEVLSERTPQPGNATHLFYLNDGNGFGSAFTGFYFLFKQGTTQRQSYAITTPVENQLIDIPSNGVNQSDVWVQTVDDSGKIITQWTKVPAMLNANVTYNTLPVSQRDIFSVVTRDNDAISIRFSDGRFGNAPYGTILVTYRVSNGYTYQIKPNEIDRVRLPFTFLNAAGVQRTLWLTFSLFNTVNNAAAAETVEQIRSRAAEVYATQNRMVSGEDLNTFPLQLNVAAKIKAVNRVYSGQSRYTRLEDPTGTYNDLCIVAEDGILFKEGCDHYTEVPASLNRTAAEIALYSVQPNLLRVEVANALRDGFVRAINNGTLLPGLAISWRRSTGSAYTSTGNLAGPLSPAVALLLQPGAMLRTVSGGSTLWTAIVSVQGSPTTIPTQYTAGPVTLSTAIPDGSVVTGIIPRFDGTLDATVLATVVEKITNKLSFSLWYDFQTQGGRWTVQPAVTELGDASIVGTSILVMSVDYLPSFWRLNVRGLRYVFESVQRVEWYDDGRRAIDSETGAAVTDLIRLMRVNLDRNSAGGHAIGRDYDFDVDRLWLYPDGTAEPRRTVVTLRDTNGDGYPDDPDVFYEVIDAHAAGTYLFWQRGPGVAVLPFAGMTVYATEADRLTSRPAVGSTVFQVQSPVAIRQNTFWLYTAGGWVQDLSGTYSYAIGRGPNVAATWVDAGVSTLPANDQLIFQWRHYAPSDHRIDPAQTNIHDMFVLTTTYDQAVRQWITAGADLKSFPLPPTELDLRLAFQSLEANKMFSDSLIWRPVRYKMLFGNGALPELTAQFKVVPLPNNGISDGEIRTRIIRAVNAYFAVENWDFGETFYFTELVSYIHLQLAGIIASCVIVPLGSNATFGDGFEVACRSDEIFVSTAQVSDVVIIASNTPSNLRLR